MPHATFWFARPFRDWIGQRSLTLHWEGRLTLRDVLQQLADEHPLLRAHLPWPGLEQDAVNVLAAVIMDGNLLGLDAEIRDGATVDVLLPLTGGARARAARLAWP
jgi:molybdopterin converting factor small subunit